MRSMADKKIAGICSGIARQYDWDVTLVRVAFLLGIVFHGVGLLVYFLAWITMPRDDMAAANLSYGA
jgi:phage shock protein C